MPTAPFIFANRYECVAPLGNGQFGVVWRAYDQNLKRWVALKLFGTGSGFSAAGHEASILVAMESDHVLRVWNADIYQDVPFIATEVAAAGAAERYLAPHGAPVMRTLLWASHLLIGLQLCHERGLLHRDVKPSNLFLVTQDEAQLGDFGVAGAMVNGKTGPHGDPRVCPPETWRTFEMTVQSDIYQVGVTMWTLLAGRYPFVGKDLAETQAAVLARAHPRIRTIAPHCPQSLALCIERAMAENPADRYSSAATMHHALGKLVRTRRDWQRIAPHSNHDSCWMGANPGGPERAVCVFSATPGTFEIEARRVGGSGSRIRPHCHTGVTATQVPVRLRAVFNAL